MLKRSSSLLWVVILAPFAVFALVSLYWFLSHANGLTGDEPHYLAISESLRRDGDVRLENDYREKLYDVSPDDKVQVVRTATGWWSVHNVGLPLMLVGAQALGRALTPLAEDTLLIPIGGDIGGAFISKLALAGFAALGFGVVFGIMLGATRSRRASALVTLTMALALPFVAGASQIYPDLPAGVVLLFATWRVLESRAEAKRDESLDALLTSLAIGFMPWIHIKLALPAVLLGLTYLGPDVLLLVRRGYLSRRLLIGAVVMGASAALLAAYNANATGNPVIGPFPPGLEINEERFPMIFLGLHLDQFQGMFIQHPFLLLGLVGVVPFARHSWRKSLLVGLVYVSVVAPNAAHFVWYGGYSFAGRFGWTGIWLWAFPMAWAVRAILDTRAPWVVGIVCIASLAYQVALSAMWLPAERAGYLLNRSVWTPLWATDGFFPPEWMTHLPSFSRFSQYQNFSPNFAALLACAGLVLTGALLQARRYVFLAATWLVVIPASAALALAGQPEKFAISAAELPSEVGRAIGPSRVAGLDEKTRQGFLMFGPYFKMRPGEYELQVQYSVSEAGENASFWEASLSQGKKVLSRGRFEPAPGLPSRELTVRFRIAPEHANDHFEYRVYYAGDAQLRLDWLRINPLQ